MAAQSQVIPFHFDSLQVRTLLIDDQLWLIASDVCAALGIVNTARSLARLDDDEKGVHNMNTLGGEQGLSIVNESGLYSLILTSRKPEAKRFKKWVTAEVLPAIRKTGRYLPKTCSIARPNCAWCISTRWTSFIKAPMPSGSPGFASIWPSCWPPTTSPPRPPVGTELLAGMRSGVKAEQRGHADAAG
ncbi:Bro-N domain-containing protein [Pokkaliibacter plantistimulans]|uniref:BRO-N domain-containing protein n=1 Tax=Pokkaliibacter plantistimulans TaxID=1635171 RepID=UPI000D74D265|nr:Bro-N domain-containing protein [Pokkaliibacter plantistimulans]